MDYTKLFYWLTVADNAKKFFLTFAILFCVIFFIVQLIRLMSEEDTMDNIPRFYDKCNKWTWYTTPLMLLFLSLWIFTPSKRDSLLIIAGGQTLNFLSTDSSASKIPSELSKFVLTELKNQAKEAAVDLNISSQKDKILDQAKDMSSKELLDKIKSDTTFAKIILEE